MGAAACLLKHGIIAPKHSGTASQHNNNPIIQQFTGVSAGSIVSAAITVGVPMDDAMNVALEIARRTREKGGLFDALTPGFSLVDEVEELMIPVLRNAVSGDEDLLRKRVNGGVLRIGYTNVDTLGGLFSIRNVRSNKLELLQKAYGHVDEFRDWNDVVAAAVISSFIPGVTGPAQVPSENGNERNSSAAKNMAVSRSMARMNELVAISANADLREGENMIRMWDGGLVNMWPTIDESTIVVSPLSGDFGPLNRPHISPCVKSKVEHEVDEIVEPASRPWPWELIKMQATDSNACIEVHVSRENMETLRRMMISSTDSILEQRFQDGYDDARYDCFCGVYLFQWPQ